MIATFSESMGFFPEQIFTARACVVGWNRLSAYLYLHRVRCGDIFQLRTVALPVRNILYNPTANAE